MSMSTEGRKTKFGTSSQIGAQYKCEVQILKVIHVSVVFKCVLLK